MDHNMDFSCSNCVNLIKELNHLRRQISTLNTLLGDSGSTSNCDKTFSNAISQTDGSLVSTCHKDTQFESVFSEQSEI